MNVTSSNGSQLPRKKNRQFLLRPRRSESFILSLEDIGIQYFDIFFKTDLC